MQVEIDFSKPKPPVTDEKREELISFRAGTKFKDDLAAMADAKGLGVSALIYEYAIKGYTDDYKTLLLLQSNADRPLRDLLR